eukprot:g3254.t1
MSITSDEVNFLVYRYLQESGFTHSSFTFAYESVLAKSSVANADIPPGALIAFLQKGLQYVDIEAHLNEDGSERPVTEKIGLLTPHVCEMLSGFDDPRLPRDSEDAPSAKRHKGEQSEGSSSRGGGGSGGGSSSSSKGGKSSKSGKKVTTYPASEVTSLRAHDADVFTIAWNPNPKGCAGAGMLASGAGDASARLWRIPAQPSSSSLGDGVSASSVALPHGHGKRADEGEDKDNPDVTTLEWCANGELLATGSYDNLVRLWDRQGRLQRTLSAHTGAIFSLKWSPSSRLLLSASLDETAVLWDVATGNVRRKYTHHSRPVLDVDWQSDSVFASCSTDMSIHICDASREKPLRSFVGGADADARDGHRDEVNAIKWDPSGRLLASCSDDNTAKLWRMDRSTCVHSLEEHSKEVYTIQWAPCGEGSANPSKQLLLASASFDSNVRLWDVEAGKCVHRLSKHADSVYSVAFSPDGSFLASGDTNGLVYIWSVRDGKVVRKFDGGGDIFDVKWSVDGERVAVCSSDRTISVMDFKQ